METIIKPETKTKTVAIRMTPTDYEIFTQAAKELKVSTSTLMLELSKRRLLEYNNETI